MLRGRRRSLSLAVLRSRRSQPLFHKLWSADIEHQNVLAVETMEQFQLSKVINVFVNGKTVIVQNAL